MYVVMVYDVSVDRVAKVLQIGRRYLTWVQNSVLEGELSPAQLARLKAEVAKAIEPTDAVRFYVLPSRAVLRIDTLGQQKNEPGQIL
ncbi:MULTISPECIES: CRISPR-associated endonuclease Cas2 [Thermus]|jgi:CRISPR-associated protein Cas2|uniref:CRISPR-associated endoribonuclease Cas2 n=1 Tax=Thermus brockianus TaxID=56956 RepID=A0A1J0LV81_THEBO|nr:CRISPR-associated endonuclease Cas2 [Thermus brockianus]APD10337.1 CRISPR-associated endoribonuclease Cas2 [Thermus brockianus]BDG17612.1 CRISPR-associated endoribonuclease Cas2 [Thermus brockianus]